MPEFYFVDHSHGIHERRYEVHQPGTGRLLGEVGRPTGPGWEHWWSIAPDRDAVGGFPSRADAARALPVPEEASNGDD